jgi:hypothetical protein
VFDIPAFGQARAGFFQSRFDFNDMAKVGRTGRATKGARAQRPSPPARFMAIGRESVKESLKGAAVALFVARGLVK